MRGLSTLVLVLWAVFLLAGCGQVPPQAMDNILGLSGVGVPITLGPASGTGKATATAASSNPTGIAVSPTQYTFVISLAESATLKGTAVQPQNFTLINLSLSLSITNGLNTVTLPTMAVSEPIDLIRSQGQGNYLLSPAPTFTTTIKGQNAADFHQLLQSGGANISNLSLQFKYTSANLNGGLLTTRIATDTTKAYY